MLKANTIVVVLGILMLMPLKGSCNRVYTHIITVGTGGGYDYNNINDAIVAMNAASPPLSASVLGKIEVYEGTFQEHLNDYYLPDGHNLPAHCDLIGEGSSQVTIEHSAAGDPEVNRTAIKANGKQCVSIEG